MTMTSIHHSTDQLPELVDVLTELGVDIKRTSGNEINGRCPVHVRYKGRESTRYSWSINSESGLWHCWTCGARGNLGHLVSALSNDPHMLWNIQKRLIISGLSPESDRQYDRAEQNTVDWMDYARFAPLPDSVLSLRNLDKTTAHRYGIRWDTSNNSTIIPIVSPMGALMGWQAKKSGWFRNYPEGVKRGTTLFGIERAYHTTGVLVESPLDVVRFHSVIDNEVSVVASFGASVTRDQIALLVEKFDRLIIAMDHDETGFLAMHKLRKNLPSFRNGVFYWHYPGGVKDIGEMTDDQIHYGLDSVSMVPPR